MTWRQRTQRALAWTAVAAAAGCGVTEKPRGAVMIVVSADMSIPKDMNHVVIEVLNDDGAKRSLSYDILPEDRGKPMPGSLAVVPPDGGGEHVRIRVRAERSAASHATMPRVVREALVNVPKDRVVMLPMPLRWLCDGHFEPTADGSFQSDCPSDQTCAAGACVSAVFDAAKLPDYDAHTAFGGGDQSGDGGSCENVEECFAGSVAVKPDADCTLALPRGTSADDVNIALAPTGGDGICAPSQTSNCLIPLDRDPSEGWRVKSGRIALPVAVCEGLELGTIGSVVLTTACPAKDSSLPICGPWAPTGEGGAPSDVNLGQAGNGVDSGSGGKMANGGAPGEGGNAGVDPGAAGEQNVGVEPCEPGSPCTLLSGAIDDAALDSTHAYFIDRVERTVKMKPLKGGAVVVLASGQDAPHAIAVDDQNVYWINGDSRDRLPPNYSPVGMEGPVMGRIMKVPLKGGTPKALIAGQVDGRALLPVGKFLYWSGGTGWVSRVPVDGGVPETLVPGVGSDPPRAFTVDATDIYWTEGSSVMAVPLLGIPKGGKSRTVMTLPQVAVALAVDDQAAYAISSYPPDSGLFRAPLAGGDAVLLARAATGEGGLALDATSAYFFQGGNPYALSKAPLAGLADGEDPTVLSTGSQQPKALAVSGADVSWLDTTLGILTLPREGLPPGGVPKLVAGPPAPSKVALAGDTLVASGNNYVVSMPAAGGDPTLLGIGSNGIADSTHAYWFGADQYGDAAILSAPFGGGTPMQLTAVSQIGYVAVDATYAYLTDFRSGDYSGIWKVPLDGSAPSQPLIYGSGAGSRAFWGIAVDATGVYYGDLLSVRKMPLSGVPANGMPTTLFADPNASFDQLSADAGGVYWRMSGDKVVRVPLEGLPDGATPTTLFTVPAGGYLAGYVLDATKLWVYYTLASPDDTSYIAVKPLDEPDDGSPPHVVWQQKPGTLRTMAVDSSALYLVLSAGLQRISPPPQ